MSLIAVATLWPGGPNDGLSTDFCLFCGPRAGADFIRNIVLFVPFGIALGSSGRSPMDAVFMGALLSGAIELAQLGLVPGRDSNVEDLASNSLGTLAGWLLWSRFPARSRAPGATVGPAVWVSASVLGFLTVSLWLFRIHYPDDLLDPRWSVESGLAGDGGRLVAARIGDFTLPSPPGTIPEPERLLSALQQTREVELELYPGPPPEGLGTLLVVYDSAHVEVVRVGRDGNDLLYRPRLLARHLRFAGGDVRFPELLAGLDPQRTVRITVTKRGGRFCASAGSAHSCSGAFTIGGTWMLLYYSPTLDSRTRAALGFIWMLLVFLPAGLATGSWKARGVIAVVVPTALWGIPSALGFGFTPILQFAGALVGIGMGSMVAESKRRGRGSKSARQQPGLATAGRR